MHANAQTKIQVTAANYCDFLNKNAVTDPGHLFDQKMGDAPETACIVRLGKPGKYSYQVIAGRENFPITYVTFLDEQSYCENRDSSLAEDDDFNIQNSLTPCLGCSRVGFSIEITSNQSCMIPGASDTVVEESTAEEVLDVGLEVGAGFLLGVAGSHLGMHGEEYLPPTEDETSLPATSPRTYSSQLQHQESFSVLRGQAETSWNEAQENEVTVKRLISLDPQQPSIGIAKYSYGLWLKTKGHCETALENAIVNEHFQISAALGDYLNASKRNILRWEVHFAKIPIREDLFLVDKFYQAAECSKSDAKWSEFLYEGKKSLEKLVELIQETEKTVGCYPIFDHEKTPEYLRWLKEQKNALIEKIALAEVNKQSWIDPTTHKASNKLSNTAFDVFMQNRSDADWDHFVAMQSNAFVVLQKTISSIKELFSHPMPEAIQKKVVLHLDFLEKQHANWSEAFQWAQDQKNKLKRKLPSIPEHELEETQDTALLQPSEQSKATFHNDQLAQQESTEPKPADYFISQNEDSTLKKASLSEPLSKKRNRKKSDKKINASKIQLPLVEQVREPALAQASEQTTQQKKEKQRATKAAAAQHLRDDLAQQQALKKEKAENEKNRLAQLAREKADEEARLAGKHFEEEIERSRRENEFSYFSYDCLTATWDGLLEGVQEIFPATLQAPRNAFGYVGNYLSDHYHNAIECIDAARDHWSKLRFMSKTRDKADAATNNATLAKKDALTLTSDNRFFEQKWKAVAQQHQAAESEWQKTLYELKKLRADLSDNIRFPWDNDIEEAEYQIAYHTVELIACEAHRLAKIATNAVYLAEEVEPKDKNFHHLWKQALDKTKRSIETWKKMVTKQEELQPSIARSQLEKWNDDKILALYFLDREEISLLWQTSNRLNSNSLFLLEEALKNPSDEKKWSKVNNEFEITQASWMSLAKRYNESTVVIPDDKKAAWIKKHTLIQYINIQHPTYTTWLPAQRAEQLSMNAYEKWKRLKPDTDAARSAKKDAFIKTCTARELLQETIRHHDSLTDKIPSSQQKKWSKVLDDIRSVIETQTERAAQLLPSEQVN